MVAEVCSMDNINAPTLHSMRLQQLSPASILTWHQGKTSNKKYWKPDFHRKLELTYEDALEITKKKIEDSVSRHLVSERPLGSFLSGGYDSTVVTAYMVKLMNQRVQTFSIGLTAHDQRSTSRQRGS